MKNAQQMFEAVMRANGHTQFEKKPNGSYKLPNMQNRYKYFLMGWEMRGLV